MKRNEWKKVYDLGVALRISWIRYNLGWSQEYMAKRFGCSQNTIKNFETGRVPNAFVLLRLAEWGDTTIEWIVTGKGDSRLESYSVRKKPPFRQTPWRKRVHGQV